ncbi:AAR074Cp [Eremothecium gossypii ATCC 10895]|uniref:AAR074Cp n=1 Tax=Eremothecium gossypii (strain ATCC 10895 / CBS 109.51 / FGSC 9923 / NRRL Y-1056) TaxID=284811 RepID=Q75EK5_EREGS|nr:AAR074Cp [Eremothecium gossypii ATCC 10895]AAS50439.1 AAR074Cp [Eremothecium gossypii ATCC 10895]AEY94725.1 FAAR074Cp [Eremothecium gossypii FDAG1]
MADSQNTPVNAQITLCAVADSRPEQWAGADIRAWALQRPLSNSQKICDLYQCVHCGEVAARRAKRRSARRASETHAEGPWDEPAARSLHITVSYEEVEWRLRRRTLPILPSAQDARGARGAAPLFQASVDEDDAGSCEESESAPGSAGARAGDDVVLTSPCSRHHHRRNSIAVRFTKTCLKTL